MDTLVTAAIIGTGQHDPTPLSTGTAIDALTAQLGEVTRERKILLTAGALAAYYQAGTLAQSAPDPLTPAEREHLSACTPLAAQLLASLLLGSHQELLAEALERLRRAHLRLPYDLLPLALTCGTQNKVYRPALSAVMGERGRWLSALNPSWSWVSASLPDTEGIPTNAETLWQEGNLEQRIGILQLLRTHAPATARDWLAAVWSQEKAEVRSRFLATWEIGLSPDDEAFLEEKALDDRGESVRALAASLLASIPTSALAQRMRARADALLAYAHGQLTVTPPAAYQQDWRRDGIIEQPPQRTGERAWWLSQILALVPPQHWETRFKTTPRNLVQAASVATDESSAWYETVLEAWSNAAIRHHAQSWLLPLWELQVQHNARGMRAILLQYMQQMEAEQQIVAQLETQQINGLIQDIRALPHPWSTTFATIYLRVMRSMVQSLMQNASPQHELVTSLQQAAIALPPACFEDALQPWELPESSAKDWQAQYIRKQINSFTEVLHIRQRFIKEIV